MTFGCLFLKAREKVGVAVERFHPRRTPYSRSFDAAPISLRQALEVDPTDLFR
jgi:hypothetical protein